LRRSRPLKEEGTADEGKGRWRRWPLKKWAAEGGDDSYDVAEKVSDTGGGGEPAEF